MKIKAFSGWWVGEYADSDADVLCRAGHSKLLACLLCSRGLTNPDTAKEFMRGDIGLLHDPYLMADMEKAVARIKKAVAQEEKVAVFGDYDVDGLTATALMTDYLTYLGLSCIPYIPERLTEGYGISDEALRKIKDSGVTLVVTVDCGITAFEQTLKAGAMGIDMIVTDHHECMGPLPRAAAVVNPRRFDCRYPFKSLAGVGVAFKLICALEGADRLEWVMERYGELTAIGTIADIMPVVDENRALIRCGVEMLRSGAGNLGLRRLMSEVGLVPIGVNGTDISFSIVPKLNAAGRMGRVKTAFDLLMSRDEKEANSLAAELCGMNFERRQVENRVFSEALEMLEKSGHIDSPIVLASENWHQGVSGIVASRLAERLGVPAVIISLDGDEGRGSCRSFGNFNIFLALNSCSDILDSFGGHALAAGLVLRRDKIDQFRGKFAEYYRYTEGDNFQMKLPIDFCVRDLKCLTVEDIDSLNRLEPWGGGNSPPSLCLYDMHVDSINPIGGDKHLKMRVSRDGKAFDCVFFSVSVKELGVRAGAMVDIAFEPGINDFRGSRTVQLLLKDVRAAKRPNDPDLELARRFFAGERLLGEEAAALLPNRGDFTKVWHNILRRSRRFIIPCDELLPDIAMFSEVQSLGKVYVCLKVFDELGLISMREFEDNLDIHIPRYDKKTDLNRSQILQRLK